MYIRVTVTPQSKKENIKQEGKDRYLVSVRALAEQNMANKAVLALISAHFKVPSKAVKIISGHHSPRKILSLDLPESK